MLRCSKSLIFRNPRVEQLHLWPRSRNGINLLQGIRRPTQLPLLLLPITLRLHLHSLPIRDFIPIPSPPLYPLLRPRTHSLSSPMSSLATPPPESNSNPPTKTGCDKGKSAGGFLPGLDCAKCLGVGVEGLGSQPTGWLSGGLVFRAFREGSGDGAAVSEGPTCCSCHWLPDVSWY
nr:uncharacterized protein LOC113697014 isoform X3 [Coffea arabica]